MLCRCSEEVAGDEYGECVALVAITYILMCGTLSLAKNLTACMATFACSIAVDGRDDKRGPAGSGQALGALHFAVAKLSCSAAEPWQQGTLHLDNVYTTHVHSVP